MNPIIKLEVIKTYIVEGQGADKVTIQYNGMQHFKNNDEPKMHFECAKGTAKTILSELGITEYKIITL